ILYRSASAGILALAALVMFPCLIVAAPRAEFTPEEEQIIHEKWPTAVETPSGLRYVVLEEGSGPKPRPRQRLTALYEGSLFDGKVFDKKLDPADPFEFIIGTNRVIEGWEEAFFDMRAGEKRILIIPYPLAYGLRGRPPDIPNRATLIFTVELLSIE
ncbi:MAG: FKBP-type peptidyl-prolyl cis-trans isomerase, partial [Opitutaceae bacterium]